MKVLVACEFSGRVREAFRKLGHDAWSCDIEPAADGSAYHIQDDVLNHLEEGWDMMIAHPPCTYLSNAGVQYLAREGRRGQMIQGAIFFNRLLEAEVPMICVENPLQHGEARKLIRKYDQIVRMNNFGEKAVKPTCLWLKGLPLLQSTSDPVDVKLKRYPNGRVASEWYASVRTGKKRSETFQGLANAMADQWGNLAAAIYQSKQSEV